ncbi:MAG: PIN domain-containing protein [Patescibacteria group bacterium]
MNACFVDTNIFIEIFTRFGKKSDSCKKLLESENNLVTTSLVISEIEWVLRSFYELPKKDVVRCLEKILMLDIDIDNKNIVLHTLQYYKNYLVDWTDCLNMFLMKENNITEVYSYDKGLKNFDWIKRIEP